MEKTTLPYFSDDLEKWRCTPHIIELSECTLSMKHILIQLYNTKFPATLSFENLEKDKLSELIKLYLTQPFEFEQRQLLDIIDLCLCHIQGIKNENECNIDIEFICESNKDLFNQLKLYLFNSVVYAVKRFTLPGLDIENDIPQFKDDFIIGVNAHWLIEEPCFEYLYSLWSDENLPLYDFPSFTIENNTLFDSVQKLNFMPLLQGFAQYPSSTFEVIKNMDELEFTE